MSSELSQMQTPKSKHVLGKPKQPAAINEPVATVGVVMNSMSPPLEDEYHVRQPITHPAPHEGYRYTSIALTAIAGLMSIASIITASFTFYVATVEPSRGDNDSVGVGFMVLLQALTLVESLFCMIAMATCFGLLFTRPYAVLIRNPENGSFICLCVSIFLLFLFSVYSFVIIVAVPLSDDRWPPRGTCAAPAVRLVALISFFSVLVANSKVWPQDPLL